MALNAQETALIFRQIMFAMSHPGESYQLSAEIDVPQCECTNLFVVLLCLCDKDTPLYLSPTLQTASIINWVNFYLGCPIVEPAEASFAAGPFHELVPLEQFPQGNPRYPDQSATLLVCNEPWDDICEISGPGIDGKRQKALPNPKILQENHLRYPLGCDFIFVSNDSVFCLPRSINIESEAPCMSQ